jgi:membrane-bound lytic murein transglycosylase D
MSFKVVLKYSLAIAAVHLIALPAFATEPAHSLVTELARPGSIMLPPSDEQALSLPGDPVAEAAQPEAVEELFTLEEIKGKSDDSAELALPDVDLPLADIPLALNSKVEYFISYFQTRGKPSFSRWLSRSSRYIPMMKEILRREGMPEDLVYVAMIESGFHLQARSWANAVGPWQFISDTGRRYSLRIDQWIDERKDPVKATTAAALYLKELYGMFNGDWYLAAAGYNAGENKILRAINMYNTNDFWELSRGSYLKRETKEYVPKLLAAAIIAKEPARYGFSDIAYLPPIEFDTVSIPSRTDLDLVARLAGTTHETIQELNPDLRHWCTPPNYPEYELKLPKGTKRRFESEYAKIPAEKRYTEKPLYAHYRAGRNDSLKTVARRFGISPATLSELNRLSPKSRIAGMTLVVPARQTVNFSHDGRTASRQSARKDFAKYYTVKKGDTLSSVSRQFNISTKLLSAWNNIRTKLALKPGRRIIIARFIEKNGEMVPVGDKG